MVLNAEGDLITGAYRRAEVVRDGMVVDYIGAVDIVRELKDEIETNLGQELDYAAVAIPPQTEGLDGGIVRNVAEAAGFKVIALADEPTAANELIGLKDGAVIDVGGGTTGVALFKNGQVNKVVDEPSGGHHFNLVIAGAKGISLNDAEELKHNASRHKEILPLVGPVIDKLASIVERSIEGHQCDDLVLVGGTACLSDIETRMGQYLDRAVIKPKNPFFVTPIGIALTCLKAAREEGILDGH